MITFMKQLILGFVIAILFSSCYKQVDTTSTSTTDTTSTTTGTTSTVPPMIKIFNVMDYGPVYVTLNNVAIDSSVKQWYPTRYKTAKIGTNTIVVKFGGDTTRVNVGVDLLAGNYYSCFIYRVGYNWKLAIVPDIFTKPTAGKSAIRLLDFRTQAYFTYINFRIQSAGISSLTYTARNFLDFQSYGYFTSFDYITAGTYNYTIYDNSTSKTLKSGTETFESTNIYTLLLMTRADLSPTDALNYIDVDCETNY